MPQGFPILSLVIWLPIAFGVAVLAIASDRNPGPARWTALAGSVLGFVAGIPLWTGFSAAAGGAMQFQELHPWIPLFNVNYHLGVDGISMPLILLNSFMTVLVVIAHWEAVTEKVGQYLAAFLIMSGLINGTFAALDAIVFYVFFEAMLIPMFLIIGVWGGPNRVYAAVKFFLYTLLGSLLMLAAFIYLYHQTNGSFEILDYHKLPLGDTAQKLIFLAMFMSFAVKVPMWPVHTWLPDAHVEAPTGGSVILAAITLKIGAYGFLRFNMPIAPDASHALAGFMIALSLVAVVYIGLVALVQADMKKLIAYSSISHMGFVTLGFFLFNAEGVLGGLVQMVSHGFISGGDVPVRGRALRPRALPANRRLRRGGQHHARVRRLLRALRHGQLGPAGHERLRGRVLRDHGGGEGELLVRVPRGDHPRLRRGLHPVDGEARGVRRGRQRERGGARGRERRASSCSSRCSRPACSRWASTRSPSRT